MDPNQTLTDIRTVLREYFTGQSESHDVAFDLADLIDALDEWITKGGFLPTDWQPEMPVADLLSRAGGVK